MPKNKSEDSAKISSTVVAVAGSKQAKLISHPGGPPQPVSAPQFQPQNYGYQQYGPKLNKAYDGGNYKTQLCRHFLNKGHCGKGDECNYAHGNHELRILPGAGLQQNYQPYGTQGYMQD